MLVTIKGLKRKNSSRLLHTNALDMGSIVKIYYQVHHLFVLEFWMLDYKHRSTLEQTLGLHWVYIGLDVGNTLCALC